jgi:hypothetical protein
MATMEFSAGSILLAIFTGVVAGLSSYFFSYSKVKAEVRAATEELRQTIQNLVETTRAVEIEKARVASDAALASDWRKAVYALAVAAQSLVHSMCWLSWDAKSRGTVRAEMSKLYDAEAHKLLPEMFGQLAVLRLLDHDLHSRAYPYVSKLTALDVAFGEAIVLAEQDDAEAVQAFRILHTDSYELQIEIDSLFGGKLQLLGPTKSAQSLVGKSDA